MTGLVRKATLLGVCGLFAASSAFAFVPDPAHSTVPDWLFVVGKLQNGSINDPVGLHTITVRDFSNNAIANALVTINFAACCDINLCQATVGVNCGARTVSGLTNASGQFTFTVLGATKDPGTVVPPNVYGGCSGSGANAVHIFANSGTGDVDLKSTGVKAVVLDLNGAPPASQSNGTSIADVANAFNLFGAVGANPANYKARGDFNCDGNVTISDVAAEFGHFGRVGAANQNNQGCTGASFCTKPACP